MLTHRSMSARDSKAACISIRVPPPRSVSWTLIVLTGMSAIGDPSVSAKASVNSTEVGRSTYRNTPLIYFEVLVNP